MCSPVTIDFSTGLAYFPAFEVGFLNLKAGTCPGWKTPNLPSGAGLPFRNFSKMRVTTLSSPSAASAVDTPVCSEIRRASCLLFMPDANLTLPPALKHSLLGERGKPVESSGKVFQSMCDRLRFGIQKSPIAGIAIGPSA